MATWSRFPVPVSWSMADEHGRERERYKLPYGSVMSVKDGDRG